MFTLRTIQANGLTFAYHELGEGPLVLCLHGFPDTADTWLHDIAPAVAKAGFRVVAPYMRGYAPTSIPSDQRFGVLELGQDVLALIQALGSEKAALIGHDWGASAVYSAIAQDPKRVSCAVTLDIPHSGAFRPSLQVLWALRHFVVFQFRERAVRWMTRDNFQAVDQLYRRWSPTWNVPAGELAAVKRSFAQPGTVEAALGYYWCFREDQRGEQGKRLRKLLRQKVAVPSLLFAGCSGPVPTALFEPAQNYYTGPFEFVYVQKSGHFIHREAPQEVLAKTLPLLDAYGRM
ncbi:alpha/beta fold hydrolase [Hyalangium versicolor]|uniref:alpha/beta fold hydrolase n=1 Tax=Hyalangium versicolor TaxID=2861190 RepID=UPI001CCD1099|nr:alpha/beta hydrolase [Hyalangium versicolor]